MSDRFQGGVQAMRNATLSLIYKNGHLFEPAVLSELTGAINRIEVRERLRSEATTVFENRHKWFTRIFCSDASVDEVA